MQKTVEKGSVVPVRFSKGEVENIEKAVERLGLKSRSALIREAVEKYIQEAGGIRVIEIRENVNLQDVKKEILSYLEQHEEAETFDIANDLRLDLNFTVKALKELWEEGRVS